MTTSGSLLHQSTLTTVPWPRDSLVLARPSIRQGGVALQVAMIIMGEEGEVTAARVCLAAPLALLSSCYTAISNHLDVIPEVVDSSFEAP